MLVPGIPSNWRRCLQFEGFRTHNVADIECGRVITVSSVAKAPVVRAQVGEGALVMVPLLEGAPLNAL